MDLTLNNYLLIINIIGFILYVINQLIYTYSSRGNIDLLVTIACLLGGSIGVLIPVLILHRKINKSNEPIIMSTVFLACIIPIQVILYIIYISHGFSAPIDKFNFFIDNNGWLIYYLIVINIITFVIYGLDKLFAIKSIKRFKIALLLSLAFVGGEIGGYLAMKLFNHKTNKDYFSYGLPLIFVMHIVILFYIIFVK